MDVEDDMIKELIKVANSLDLKGLTKEADLIDRMIKKISSEESLFESEKKYSEKLYSALHQIFLAINDATMPGEDPVPKMEGYRGSKEPGGRYYSRSNPELIIKEKLRDALLVSLDAKDADGIFGTISSLKDAQRSIDKNLEDKLGEDKVKQISSSIDHAIYYLKDIVRDINRGDALVRDEKMDLLFQRFLNK